MFTHTTPLHLLLIYLKMWRAVSQERQKQSYLSYLLNNFVVNLQVMCYFTTVVTKSVWRLTALQWLLKLFSHRKRALKCSCRSSVCDDSSWHQQGSPWASWTSVWPEWRWPQKGTTGSLNSWNQQRRCGSDWSLDRTRPYTASCQSTGWERSAHTHTQSDATMTVVSLTNEWKNGGKRLFDGKCHIITS